MEILPPHTGKLYHSSDQEKNVHSLKFERVFAATKDRLHYFVAKLTGDPADTKDIIQECYLRLWQKIADVHEDNDVLPLLFTYARHCVIDHLRKKASRKLLQQQLEQQAADTAATTADDNHHYYTQLARLQHSIDELPPRRKQIFTLVKQEGLSHKAVAQQLQISPDTVEKQVSLSLRFLREKLQP